MLRLATLSTLALLGCAVGPAPCASDASSLAPLRTRWTGRFGSARDQHATAVTSGLDGSIFVGGFGAGGLPRAGLRRDALHDPGAALPDYDAFVTLLSR